MFDPRKRRLVRRYQRLPMAMRSTIGNTPRPKGSGGSGRNTVEGQWASQRFFGYNSSQLPVIDRLRPASEGGPRANLLDVRCSERSQFTISVSGRELSNADPFVGDPIPTKQQVLDNGTGLSELQLELEFSLGGGKNNRLFLDVGAGWTITLPAVSIQMYLLLPLGAIDLDTVQGGTIPLGPPDPITGGVTAFNSALFWATVNRSDIFSAIPEWQLTRGLFAPAGATTRIAIPEGADFVEGWETLVPSPAGATPFLNFETDAPFRNVGQYSQALLPTKRFVRTRIPGNAKFINSGPANGASPRLFLLTFTVRP